MTLPRPPHLHKQYTRHGKLVWYVRVGKGPRTRIREDYGTPEFMAAYHAAIAASNEPAVEQKSATAAKSGTLSWLISRYRESAAWASLSPATRRQSEHFLHVIESAGEEPFAKITTKTIAAARDRRKATPFAAKNFLKAMRRLFDWAVESQFVDSNPTDAVKISLPGTDGFHSWSKEEVRQFEARGWRNTGSEQRSN